jgi:hypothetical protein
LSAATVAATVVAACPVFGGVDIACVRVSGGEDDAYVYVSGSVYAMRRDAAFPFARLLFF